MIEDVEIYHLKLFWRVLKASKVQPSVRVMAMALWLAPCFFFVLESRLRSRPNLGPKVETKKAMMAGFMHWLLGFYSEVANVTSKKVSYQWSPGPRDSAT